MTERRVAMVHEDAVELLVRQHQEIRRLLREVEGNAGEVRVEVFVRLRRFLAMHETIEQEIIHPLVRRRVGDQVIDARREEENQGERVLRELAEIGPASPDFAPLFAEFRTAVLRHAEYEEQQEFPELRTRGNAETHAMAVAITMAEAMAMDRVLPGVESARKNLFLRPFAAVADRIRDLVGKVMGPHHG
jgi:iron-sulfur cluster repair protein YtfE (RIC family)